MREEPAYRVFDYECPHCGAKYRHANSVRLHPDHQICPECGKSGAVEPAPVIRLAGKASQVFSYMALLARYRGNTTLGELANEELCSQ